MIRICTPFILVLAYAAVTAGATNPADKRQYNLFNATPPERMRELSADRPDVTESPYTVDAGHVQLEMSFVDYIYDEDGVRTRAFTIAPFNLKLGLLNNVDLQLVVEPYVEIDIDDDVSGADQALSGFGDTQIRLKINLWGNDGGKTAFAIMPFFKFPTGSREITNDHVEGGLIVPFAIELPAEFSLGLMAEFDVVYDDADDDYEVEFVHSAALGRDILGKLAGYVEYVGVAPFHGDSDYQSLVGAGVTYLVNDNTQLDAGVNFGLTNEADDYNVFAGITLRL